MTKRAAITVGMVASLFGACTPDLTEGHFACEDGRCPSGWFCRADNRCYSTPVGGADAGGGDAGPFDGGGIDSGAHDGGTTDAGGPGDSGPPVDGGPCDPVMQTGCDEGDRCTLVSEGTTLVPTCAGAGTIPLLEPCTAPPESTPDDCVEGLLCVSGTCRPLCNPMSSSSCATGFVCGLYSGFPEDVGLCDATCDPVRQTRDHDGAAACGSDPVSPSVGCYGAPEGPFFCATVPAAAETRMHRDSAGDPVFLNSCAPGFMPLLPPSPGEVSRVCVALCDPEPTYSGNTADRQGVSPYACPDRGATATSEECRFMDSFAGMSLAGPEVGFCYDYVIYETPSCASFTMSADSDADTIPDYVEEGCGPLP